MFSMNFSANVMRPVVKARMLQLLCFHRQCNNPNTSLSSKSNNIIIKKYEHVVGLSNHKPQQLYVNNQL